MMKLKTARRALSDRVRPATDADLRFVICAMRESNARELFATHFGDDCARERLAIARNFIALNPRLIERWCFLADNGNPGAVFCAWLASPGVAQMFMVATERWNEVALTGYLFWRDVLNRRGLTGIHRCETLVLEGSDYRWLLKMGCRVEGPPIARGKNRERFIRIGWEKPEDPHVRNA